MSKFSSLNDNPISLQNFESLESSNNGRSGKLYYFSEQKLKENIYKCDDDDYYDGFNSCPNNDNKILLNSLINPKNIKEKEFSLLYLIKTFNRSYSSESNEKNNIIDFPKISKKLFPSSNLRHKSSTNLNFQNFTKYLHLSKRRGDVVNNLISSIYERQLSGGDDNNSPKKGKISGFSNNSGNKLSVFSNINNENAMFHKLLNNNISRRYSVKEFNYCDSKETKALNEESKTNKIINSTILLNIFKNDKDSIKEESKAA